MTEDGFSGLSLESMATMRIVPWFPRRHGLLYRFVSDVAQNPARARAGVSRHAAFCPSCAMLTERMKCMEYFVSVLVIAVLQYANARK